jgi:hypothetical protein
VKKIEHRFSLEAIHAKEKLMNTYLRFLVPSLLAMGFVNADNCETQCEAPIKEEQKPNPCQPNFYEYHNRIAVFSGLHQTYERIKTDAFYVGVEVWGVPTWSTDHGSDTAFLGEAELRFGYNYFYNGRDHVTPFVGVGVIRDFRKEHFGGHRTMKPAVAYGVFGFLYEHEFNRLFTLGFNAKGLVGGQVDSDDHDWGNPVGGIDVALPITFRFGYHRRWDFRIEPFDVYLRGSHISRNYFGFRSTVGFRF